MSNAQSPTDRRQSEFANEAFVNDADVPALDALADRGGNQGAEPGAASEDDVHQPIGARPRSETTGRHDDGAGANETVDGLSDTEEATRRAAEDLPTGRNERDEDTPVFDRGDTPPRV
jgi:hypothetical protein